VEQGFAMTNRKTEILVAAVSNAPLSVDTVSNPGGGVRILRMQQQRGIRATGVSWSREFTKISIESRPRSEDWTTAESRGKDQDAIRCCLTLPVVTCNVWSIAC